MEGLRDVIASFADGSQDSINAVAGMASASDEDLRAMVENWKTLQAEQDAAAGSIADLKTNFTQEMDALGQELAADIQAMNLGQEAAEAGKSTIQAFIDGANGMKAQVMQAYAGIAAAAKAALGNAGAGSSAAGNGNTAGSGANIGHYAKGTVSAEPGFAEVGENGPEMVFLNGGEKILTAAETAKAKQELSPYHFAVQQEEAQIKETAEYYGHAAEAAKENTGGGSGAGQIIINSNPVFNMDGKAPDDLEEKLERNNQIIIQMVMEALTEKKDNRRTYFE